MDHRGHIQVGGAESGESWAEGVCRLSEHEVAFLVNDIEVMSLPRANAQFDPRENSIYKIDGADEPIFFRPQHNDGFEVDLAGEPVSAADRVRLAASQGPPPPSQGLGVHAPPKSRITAGLLAIFLGGLGAHKFYLGEIGLGIIYLLFSWTFIPAIVGLIEGIIYLTKSDQEFLARYG